MRQWARHLERSRKLFRLSNGIPNWSIILKGVCTHAARTHSHTRTRTHAGAFSFSAQVLTNGQIEKFKIKTSKKGLYFKMPRCFYTGEGKQALFSEYSMTQHLWRVFTSAEWVTWYLTPSQPSRFYQGETTVKKRQKERRRKRLIHFYLLGKACSEKASSFQIRTSD